jgi:hypothetical protein
MKRLSLMICVFSLMSSVAGTTLADTWQVVYQTDFSTDPQWTTDQTSNYYWDTGSQSYHIRAENLAPGYKPSRYSYKLLDEGVSSFELQWDIKLTRCDWSAGLPFGIYDTQLGDWYGVSDFVEVHPVVADGGRFWAMTLTACGEYRETSVPYDWSFGQTYTCKIVYDSDLLNVSVQIKTEDQQLVWSSNLSVPGTGFNNDLKYLGSSRNGVGDYGYNGFSPWAVAEGNIDNVVLSVVPEPAIPVGIDIKPGSYPNAINLSSQGLTPVAILSAVGFDARTVNPATVSLSGALVAMRGKDKYMAHEEDVNKDGLVDLVVQVVTCDIDTAKLQQDGDVIYAVLTGSTVDGTVIEGEDEITIVPSEK